VVGVKPTLTAHDCSRGDDRPCHAVDVDAPRTHAATSAYTSLFDSIANSV